MLSRFRKVLSLYNLIRHPFSFLRVYSIHSSKPSGQIATILLLFIVAALILVLVTMNIGTVSSKTMAVVTGADTAGMYLGSNLASRSNSLYHALGDDTRVCVKGGLLGLIAATIAAIVVTVISYGSMSWYGAMLVAAAAGAAAGAAGQYIIHGTAAAAAQGAAMGGMIGLAIGSGPAAVYSWSYGTAYSAAIAGGATTEAAVSTATAAAAGVMASASGVAFSVGVSTVAGAAAAYNAALTLDVNGAAIRSLVNAMNGLPEFEGIRENTFFQALQQVVDDPNKVVDVDDLDGDNNTSEEISAFVYWWNDHIADLKASLGQKGDDIAEFLQEVFIPFFENVRFSMLPYLDRREVECPCSTAESRGVGLLRVLQECGYGVSWLPGPDQGSLIDWYCDPEDTAPPAGFDYIDALRYILEEFVSYGRGVLKEKEDNCGIYYEYDIDTLDKQLKFDNCVDNDQDWFDILYCPGDDTSLWSSLRDSIDLLQDGLDQIQSVRDSLPGCQLQYGIYEERYVSSGFEAGTEGRACQCPIPSNDLDLIIDPENGETVAACEEIYPCYWVDQSSEFCGAAYDTCGLQNICSLPAAACLEDVHFPNYPCKVYSADQTQLLNEINTLRTLVTNLESTIRSQYFCGGNPCGSGSASSGPPAYTPDIPAGCPTWRQCRLCPRNNCTSSTRSINITVGRVCLYGNMHGPCSHTALGSGQGQLKYDFTYTITCRCCHPETRQVCTTNTTTNITTCTNVTTCVCTTTTHSGQAWGCTRTVPDIDLNLVGTCSGSGNCLSRAGFLARLDRFEEFLLDLNRDTNPCDSDASEFATIDEDADDEFEPVTRVFCTQLEDTQEFVDEVPTWEPRLGQDSGSIPRATTGEGTVTYPWDDNRGHHEVTVNTGPFRFAWIRKHKSGNFLVNKTCLILTDYCDNNPPGGCSSYRRLRPGDTYVEVIRQDDPDTRDLPSAGSVNLGLRWNPFNNAGRVRRRSRVSYHHLFVGVGGIN